MSSELLGLPWLVEAPMEVRASTRHLASPAEWRPAAQRLAQYRLDSNQLHGLGVAIAQRVASESDALRVGILSNGTVDLLLPAITASAARHGVWIEPIGSGFDQVAAQALDPHSRFNRRRCHYVLLALDHRGLRLAPTPGDLTRAEATLVEACAYHDSLRHGLRQAGSTVIVQTAPQVPTSLFGSLDRRVPGTLQWLIERYNQHLRSTVASTSDLLLDTAALAESIGVALWHNPAQWVLGKFSCAHSVVPLYADWLGRLLAAARGKARKCLVLDLDNTLWGGVIGEDGLAGIQLGNHSPAGEAYLCVQQAALALRERGILLAVASKNDEDIARSAFRSHPDMVLTEAHISVFRANWQDKASNLRSIAHALNIDLSALVLLDDDPVERAQVRAALPDVVAPELPDDPAQYADTLYAAGYFESVAFTTEDGSRADLYRADTARQIASHAAIDLDAHLRSLDMRAICQRFDPINRPRIIQLINKTNQFNLTTRRYTEAQVEQFERSTSGLTLQMRLIDRFGDNGIIAVVICVEENSAWLIDSWLMSCRVLNRQVEHATLDYLVCCARTAGIDRLVGEYVSSGRNHLVKDHYARLGFTPIDEQHDRTRWQLQTSGHHAPPLPIRIVPTLTDIETSAVRPSN